MGLKRSTSGARVLLSKKRVTASSPLPFTSCSASSTLSAFTVCTSTLFASGTACSAARFIAVTSSSTRRPWPVARSSLAAFCRPPGSSIFSVG